ncbi:MAG: hypothetical protein LBS64_01455 [Spirochaetaceae bacterium]|jgi:hypothetical protein|nr:hypothetical protein [Spirochaetaceae bacterium]
MKQKNMCICTGALALLVLYVSCATGKGDGAETPEFLMLTVVNKTEWTLEEIYCFPAYSKLQGDELLSGAGIQRGQRRAVLFEPLLFSAYWDILAVDSAGNEYTVYGVPSARMTAVFSSFQRTESDGEDGDFSTEDDSSFGDLEEFFDDIVEIDDLL